MKRINISLLRVIPEMVFDQHLHSDLSVWHDSIINDEARPSTKAKLQRTTKVSDKLQFVVCWLLTIIGRQAEACRPIVFAFIWFVGKYFKAY